MQLLIASQIFEIPRDWVLPYERGRAGDATKKCFFEYALPRIVLGGFVSEFALQRLIIEAKLVTDGRGAAGTINTLLREMYLMRRKPNTKEFALGLKGEQCAKDVGVSFPLSPARQVKQVLRAEEKLLFTFLQARARYDRLAQLMPRNRSSVLRVQGGAASSSHSLALG